MTEKIFHSDPYVREFSARVIERICRDGRKGLILDRTAFYGTSGGQPHDTGTLNGVRVLDVVEEGTRIIHLVESDVPGDEVRGVIDWDRRLDHMQQHHGQHILSEAFIRVANAHTVSFHLGQEVVTIDVDRNDLSEYEVGEAQKLANRVVFDDRPVSIRWHSPEEARALPIRKFPDQVEGPLRIVSVADFDVQPCSGTHPKSSGQVGVIAVLGWERQKNCTRISFVCGGRAARALNRVSKTLKALSSKLSSSPEELEAAVDRRMAEEASLRKIVTDQDKVIAKVTASEMVAAARPIKSFKLCTRVMPGKDMRALKTVAMEATGGGGIVAAVLGPSTQGTAFVFGASADVAVDLRPILRAVLIRFPGKGGGEARFVQGSFQSGETVDLLATIEAKLQETA